MKPLLGLPELETLRKNIDEDSLSLVRGFWKSLWLNYVRNKGSTSLIYWTEKFECPEDFNKVLIILKEYVTADVIPERNWAQVSLNETTLLNNHFTEAELVEYRKNHKFTTYVPEFKESNAADLVRVNGQVSQTGLIRAGFAAAANTQYYYDSYMLSKHMDQIIKNTNKGMIKMREQHALPMDDASYDQVATKIVEHIANNPELYTQGISYIDSRGRAIKESLKYVANPIGYKDFRALLTIPEPAADE